MKHFETQNSLWEQCVRFHGHECGGLALGFQAARYAAELLEIDFSDDEQVVCVAENDACGIDAIQVLLGCSVGKGNLLFHLTGKQAFTFFCRSSNRSVRLVAKEKPSHLKRGESMQYYLCTAFDLLFDQKPAAVKLPEPAKIFRSVLCEKCGERTAENYVRLQNGKLLCCDCADQYSRFDI